MLQWEQTQLSDHCTSDAELWLSHNQFTALVNIKSKSMLFALFIQASGLIVNIPLRRKKKCCSFSSKCWHYHHHISINPFILSFTVFLDQDHIIFHYLKRFLTYFFTFDNAVMHISTMFRRLVLTCFKLLLLKWIFNNFFSINSLFIMGIIVS